MAISFTLNGQPRAEASVAATMTVLDYLREIAGLTGTKEGCAEGDCGACTVVMAPGGTGPPLAVNACLLAMAQLDGAALITVEGLEDRDGSLDPVQEAIVRHDGTQCGFCTPGFVMALYALRHGSETITDTIIHEALAGNLCRCTGYRSIVDAARAVGGIASGGPVQGAAPERCAGGGRPRDRVHEGEGGRCFFPSSIKALVARRAEYPDAMLLAGGTDLGLVYGKAGKPVPVTIATRGVAELRAVEDTATHLVIGSAVTYSEALPQIEAAYPSFGGILRRLGSRQIRNVGTIGGNIGNASPIGDTLPCLVALDAVLLLHGVDGRRELPFAEYFLDYRQTDLRHGEIIEGVRIPKPGRNEIFRAYKVSKRHDQDISAVIAAFRLTLVDGVVAAVRIGFGGMAATPRRAPLTEAALLGQIWAEPAVRRAAAAVAGDFSPIDDHRASAAYRLRVAGNLLHRLFRDLAGEDAVEVVTL